MPLIGSALGLPAMSFRKILTDLRSMNTSVQWQESSRAKTESKILDIAVMQLQKSISAKSKDLHALEAEISVLRATMNQRLAFYRQLQQISDLVAPLEEEPTENVDQSRVDQELLKEKAAEAKLASLRTKHRFLLHLRSESTRKEPEVCTICTDAFEIGILTICGHVFCADCLLTWLRERRTCPLCKRHLRSNDVHQITFKPSELRAVEETSSPHTYEPSAASGASAQRARTSIYSTANSTMLDQIKNMELLEQASYGIKVDTITRHLLWIRDHDPGAKTIVFSQYRDFLHVLGQAFHLHKIGCVMIGTKGSIEKFKNDPAIECFLLDAKSDSSGLNLTNATYVFLTEPLVNTAIELQAIARVHRIGQVRPTQVFMYLTADTVEESVYEVSVARRLEHMRRGKEASAVQAGATTPDVVNIDEKLLDSANTLELQSAPMQKFLTRMGDGEMVPKDDLWKCLFGRPRPLQADALAHNGPLGTMLRADAAEGRREL